MTPHLKTMASVIEENQGLSVGLTFRHRAAYFVAPKVVDRRSPDPVVLIQEASHHPFRLLIIDLRGTIVLDSEGAAWLEQVSALGDAHKVRVRLVSPRGSKVRRLLQLLKFDRFVLIGTSLHEALRFGRPLGSVRK